LSSRPRAPQAAATEGLYERHAAKLQSYCLHQLGSREEAEDASRTTFMNAFRALGRGVVPEAESAWLFKIAENVCLFPPPLLVAPRPDREPERLRDRSRRSFPARAGSATS
jgi:hypothetical protein